jgi:hypothetical protein
MKFTVATIAAFAAAAAGQELSSNGGDITMRVERQVSISDLQSTIAAMSVQMSAMEASMSNGIVAAMVNTQAAATSTAVANEGRLARLEQSMPSLSTSVSTLSSNVNAQLAQASNAVAASLVQIDDTIDNAIANIGTTVNSTLSRAAVEQAGVVSTLTAAVSSKADAQPKIWTGGCSQHPGSSWHWYCLDRQLYYTANGYMRKSSNTRMTSQRAGYFRVAWWTIKQGSGWTHNDFYLNGMRQYHSYMHTAGCWWQDDSIDFTYHAQNNWWFSVRSYTNCGHSFHHGGARDGGSGYHSRIHYQWVGPE